VLGHPNVIENVSTPRSNAGQQTTRMSRASSTA
jgi:hypothetical protein